jgi:SAM-dependent methyltransferase
MQSGFITNLILGRKRTLPGIYWLCCELRGPKGDWNRTKGGRYTDLVPDAVYTIEDQERMSHANNYFAWQSEMVTRELGRRVVEVGCGIGNFTKMLLDRELVVAIDIEPGCVEKLRERYRDSHNLHAYSGDAADVLRRLGRYRPDSCVCLNVLEHIEDDYAAVEAMAGMLDPGGVIVLIVPAFEALNGPIDRNLGHFRRYNRSSIARLAKATGLRIKNLRFMNIIGFFGWWANSHIFKREAQSAAQIRLFDRYIVSVMSRVERLIPPPFGQSLFVVLQKP